MIKQINFETIQEIWYEEDMWGQLAYANPVSSMLYKEGFNKLIHNLEYSNPVFYAYFKNNKILGVNSYHKVNEVQCRSRGLYVYPKYRKNNIGVELLKYAIEQNKNKSYKFIWSMPRSTAITTYKKAGYTITTDIFSHLQSGEKTLYENCFCKHDFI
jgi:GNAT superfamily N-acetyltransferase